MRPVTYREACAYINAHHRHHHKPQGWKFGIGLFVAGSMSGVLTAGRPVARKLDDGLTLEITRCCTDGTRNACSRLYGAARRAGFAMGYRRIITYTLQREPGASLAAAGFTKVGPAGGPSWNVPSRPRKDRSMAQAEPKWLWEWRAPEVTDRGGENHGN